MSTIRSKKSIFFLLLPGLAFILLFFLFPLLYVLWESFQSEQAFFTLTRYIKVLKDKQFQHVFMRTLRVALIVTPLAVLLGYPSAYLMTKVSSKKKSILTSLVILPLMTSPVARTYAWIVILGKYGIINKTLTTFRILEEPTRLLYTEGAIIVGLLQLFMPIMVLTLVSSMENAPSEVEEAAMSLGSNRIGTFFRVVVPLSFEGLMMGITLVFTGCFTAYVTPAILGGAKVLTLSTLMRQNALALMDWEGATVIAVIMILTTLVIYNGVRLFKPRSLV